jgi:3-oxoacyl-(acyl-carrier-protein) synthase
VSDGGAQRSVSLADEGVEALGPLAANPPPRWGRMDRISRVAVVAVTRLLLERGVITPARAAAADGATIGLIGGSRYGSLATDLAYCAPLPHSPALVSPTLFSYTLANIALAEAASYLALRGPVYSLYCPSDPLPRAVEEAERWLACSPGVDAIVAGELDLPPEGLPIARFQLVSRPSWDSTAC